MDNAQIIEQLEKYKASLLEDVVDAYAERGTRFGRERLSSWKNGFNRFLDEHLKGESDNLSRKLHKIILVVKRSESDLDTFWREDGEIIISFIDSLVIDIKSDNYISKSTTNTGVVNADIKHNKMNSVYIGHGRSKLWARVQVFLEKEQGLTVVSYESESRVSQSIISILEEMLEVSSFAVLILTAEDETGDGSYRARQNVVHEAGLFQGRLGFKKVVLLVQKGLENFTNVDGLQYMPFSNENIEQSFYELQRVLRREGVVKTERDRTTHR